MSEFSPLPFVRDKLIRFQHCDPAGIVFYAQYFILFNELIEDWFNAGLGIDFATLHTEHRLGVPVAHVDCDWVAPSKVGERLRLALSVKKIGKSSITLAIDGSAEGQPRVRANLVVVFASLDEHKSVPIDAEFRAKLWQFAAPA